MKNSDREDVMAAAQATAGAGAEANGRLRRLADLGPIFRDPATLFGTWQGATGKGTDLEPFTSPWFKTSAVGDRFFQTLYDAGWILPDFDWPQWIQGPEGQRLWADREAIGSADEEQLAKLLTALVRSDRFSEGTLAKAYNDKVLLSIVERAENLLR